MKAEIKMDVVLLLVDGLGEGLPRTGPRLVHEEEGPRASSVPAPPAQTCVY